MTLCKKKKNSPAFLDSAGMCFFFPLLKLNHVRSVSISSDSHINSLQGDVVCCKHWPLQDQWHHFFFSVHPLPQTWSKASGLNYHFTEASQWRWTTPADSKQTSELLSWSIITKVDCTTEVLTPNSKQQLQHSWLFISFKHILRAPPSQKLHQWPFWMLYYSFGVILETLDHKSVRGLEKLDK